MKKTYPKVPNHYADPVDPSLFAADDLVLLEKLDGSNARVMLYDTRYASHYGEEVHNANPTDGDILIGSKGHLRGCLSDSKDTFDGNFGRLLDHLREHLDRDTFRECHDQHDSPLLLFGEHMVKHTLDYEYTSNPPPAFLGFDVFKLTEYTQPPANPFNEDFSGFLDLDAAWDIFARVGLDTVSITDTAATGFDPDEFTVPNSEYGGVQAEGVVLRSDQRQERAKYVTAEFRERMSAVWGMHEEDAETGADLFIARYITNARLRKQVNKLAQRDESGPIDPETVATAAVADAWEEELHDIRSLSIGLVPQDIYPQARDRAAEVITTMRTNAQLNETTLDRLWEEHGETVDDTTLGSLDADTGALNALATTLRDADDTNRALARALCEADAIHTTAERIATTANRSMGRWLIEETYDELLDELWFESLDCIASLPVEITPTAVNDALLDYVTEELEAREDVDTTEKPDDWQPSVGDADTSGLGDLF